MEISSNAWYVNWPRFWRVQIAFWWPSRDDEGIGPRRQKGF